MKNSGSGLSSPMGHNLAGQPPKGGDAGGGGDREGWSVMNQLGAPKAAVDEPSLQITQDIGGSLDGRKMPFPSGTAMNVPETSGKVAGISDFVFGRGTLKKAAGDNSKSSEGRGDAGIDIAKMAQESADRARKSEAPKSSSKKGPAKRASKR